MPGVGDGDGVGGEAEARSDKEHPNSIQMSKSILSSFI